MPSTASLPCSGTKYSADCIAQVAASAGFNKSKEMLSTAVAVALAESSGRTQVSSPTGCCYGLWQINVNVHPYSKAQMQNPTQNAAAAYSISKQGTDWKPWSAYTNGSYLLYKPTANAAADKITTTGSNTYPSIATDALDDLNLDNPFDDIMQPIVAVKDWISDRNNIFRILKVLAGATVAVVGIHMIMKQPVQQVIKAVKQ